MERMYLLVEIRSKETWKVMELYLFIQIRFPDQKSHGDCIWVMESHEKRKLQCKHVDQLTVMSEKKSNPSQFTYKKQHSHKIRVMGK